MIILIIVSLCTRCNTPSTYHVSNGIEGLNIKNNKTIEY